MRQWAVLGAVLGLLVLCACGGGPVLPFLPGGAISGEVKAVPDDWSFAADAGTVQLETRPEDPYSVNIVCVPLNGKLYIYAGDTETEWAQHISVKAEVRFRLAGDVYELRAQRVTDTATVQAFGDAWVERSPLSTHAADYAEMWMYELVAR